MLLAPLAYLASQLGGDYGKRLEPYLWDKWGGPPTTRFLRHSNNEFNSVTRARVHDKLRALRLDVPSRDEQELDAVAADSCYQSCAHELIRRTRDADRFPLVFKGLVDYGLRRNLLALKPLAVPIAASALLVSLFSVVSHRATNAPSVAHAATVVTAALLLSWLVWVKDRAVKLAADRYARFLLEAALDLD